MNRREFLESAAIAATLRPRPAKTKHAVWIINGGSRKTEYQDADLSPNFVRLAREGLVYEESHNDSVAKHEDALSELLSGVEYVRRDYGDTRANYQYLNDSLADVATVLKQLKPRLIICRETSFDVGHLNDGYFRYLDVCRATDAHVGELLDFIRKDPYFSSN